MNDRYSLNAGSLSLRELRAVWTRLQPGAKFPSRVDPGRLVELLAGANWTRFEFEVNRLRGFAFDNGETGEGILQ